MRTPELDLAQVYYGHVIDLINKLGLIPGLRAKAMLASAANRAGAVCDVYCDASYDHHAVYENYFLAAAVTSPSLSGLSKVSIRWYRERAVYATMETFRKHGLERTAQEVRDAVRKDRQRMRNYGC